MLANPAIQNVASRAWDGTTAYAADVTDFISFGYSFEVITNIATDAVFKVQSAPPSEADPCLPGAFTDVEAIATCAGEALAAGTLAEIRIPAGTPARSICSATIPCRPNAFLRLAAVSGDTANVIVTLVRHGPFR